MVLVERVLPGVNLSPHYCI